MSAIAKPTLFVSKCLGLAVCRWNGEALNPEVTRRLAPHAKFVAHCPEVELGLGVPRPPVRLVEIDGRPHMLQRETGADLTARMHELAGGVLGALPPVDGFIFKARSPSCGLRDTKLYARPDAEFAAKRTAGLFAGEAQRRFVGLPIEDEGRLTNFTIRERFLTAVFTLADFRRTRRAGRLGGLVEFHSRHKLLMMACSQKELKGLGALVANRDGLSFDDLAARYEQGLRALLRSGPKIGTTINVLLHAFGYFKKSLKAAEKAHFLDLLAAYRDRRVPLSAPAAVLRSWIEREDEDYLRRQSFFAPYPGELSDIADSGAGRDY